MLLCLQVTADKMSKPTEAPNGGSLQQHLYLPQFLTKPIDSSTFPEACVAPRVAQRGIEVCSSCTSAENGCLAYHKHTHEDWIGRVFAMVACTPLLSS